MHIVNHEFGFGGVGGSGYGRYGGYEGFKQWSNAKSVMIKPATNFYPYNAVAPPFTQTKIESLRKLFKVKGYQNVLIKTVVWILLLIIAVTLIAVFRH